ncbi:MAG: single-stranded DNA-binding protein [Fastidiosipilaceae bacterium]|jgi:single-strand DNA-binding protein|nr:single-stranded DNA-binding protein [Clostridiaceae bacterium]
MNRAILLGRLVRDPELRTTQNGTSVCSFTLAIDRRFKNQYGERQTDFIPCVAWSKTAEFCAQYFSQGQRMALLGSIQPRSWEDQEGNRRYTTEVVAEEIYFADSKKSSGNQGQNYGGSYGGNYSSNQKSGGQFGDGFSRGGSFDRSTDGFDRGGGNREVQSTEDNLDQDDFFPTPDDDTSLPFNL